MANGVFGGGTGTFSDPFIVEDAKDLNQIRFGLSSHYKLKYSINLGIPPYNQGKGWEPIGVFAGTLNGNGKKIFNLHINRPGEDNVGLFGDISVINIIPSRIFDLGVENAKVRGRNRVGILFGQHNVSDNAQKESIVNRCYVTGEVEGNSYVGGIAGNHYWHTSNATPSSSLFANCIANVRVKAAQGEYCGLIAGHAFTRYANTHNQYIGDNVIAIGTAESMNEASPFVFAENAEATRMRNCFYNSDIWTGRVNTGTTGLSTERLKNPANMTALEEARIDDFTPVWTFNESRYPQLTFTAPDHIFILANGKYFTYNPSQKVWEEKYKHLPNREQAVDHGMRSLDIIDRHGWNLLRDFGQVEMINILEKSAGADIKSEPVIMNMVEEKETEKKRFFTKEIIFSQFGDDIANINS